MMEHIFKSNDWTIESIEKINKEIDTIAINELSLNMYPMQIEIISADQMLDAYSTHALPIYYDHWSMGKKHAKNEYGYKNGHMGLAYEIIANTDPCIAYLMENNTMVLQTLVLAHCTGHNHFFKNNYMFKQWTQADSIVDFMKFSKEFISNCEEKYGIEEVERTLDACHAIQYQSIDKYKRKPIKKNNKKEKIKHERETYNDLWRVVPSGNKYEPPMDYNRLPEPEENLLYFMEKHSPKLEQWQKEICRIVRKISQYFYPQIMTKVMNEGFAVTCHYYIMNRLWEKKLISEGQYLEFIDNHCGVLTQTYPDLRTDEEKENDRKRGKREPLQYSGLNPYALGFAIFQDIKRMCEYPTDEDREWFPDIVGKNWVEVCLDVVNNYRDESFIRQFLSPKVIRDLKLFTIHNVENKENSTIDNIHNDKGYKNIRNILADSYDFNKTIPNIQVCAVNHDTDRKLFLQHYGVNDKILDDNVHKVLNYIEYLWGYDVELTSIDAFGDIMEVNTSGWY